MRRAAYPLLAIFLLLFVTQAYATDLNYWIEDSGGTPTKVWVKVPEIPANGTATIYVRKEAGHQPNGGSVFEFFDDFEGTSLDTSKWQIDPNNAGFTSVSVSGGLLRVGGGSDPGRVATIPQWTQAVYSAHFKASSDSGSGLLWEVAANDLKADGAWTMFGAQYSSGKKFQWYDNGVLSQEVRQTDMTQYHTVTYYYDAGVLQRIEVDTGETYSESYTQIDDPLRFNVYAASGITVYVDWVFVRKYAEQDPTVTVTDLGDYYQIDISNPNSTDLTDFQISIPASDLDVSSTTESLHFSDQPFSGISVSVSYSPNTTEELALDPENGKNEVNVTYTATISKVNTTVTYWKWVENGTVIEEGNTDINTATLTRTYDTVGDYNVCFYAEGVDGSNTEFNAIDCKTVHIDQYPQGITVEWNGDNGKIVFPDENITFTVTAQDNGTLSYSWDFDDNTTATGNTITHDYNTPGTYHVKVTATDDLGLSKTKTVTIPIYSTPYLSPETNAPYVDSDVRVDVNRDDRLTITNNEWNTTDANAVITPYIDHAIIHFLTPGDQNVHATVTLSNGEYNRTVDLTTPLNVKYITLSVTLKDEDTGSTWDTSAVDLTHIEVWDADTETYIGSVDNATSYTKTDLTRKHYYRVVVTIQGAGLTYTRTYYISGYDMSLTAYALSPSAGVYFTHGVRDAAGNPLEGYYDQVLRYVNGAWITISDMRTTVDGTVSLFIRPSTYYKVRILNPDRQVVKEFTWFADPNVRTVYVTVTPEANVTAKDYTTVYDRIQYSLLPSTTELEFPEDTNTPPTPISWKVSDTAAAIKWFSMTVEKSKFPYGTTTIYEQNVTDHPEGGEITYTPDEKGVYTVTAAVYVDGATAPLTIVRRYVYGSTGSVGTAPEGVVSSSTLLLLGIILAAVVVGWAAQYDPIKAGLLGLGVFAVLTIYAPWLTVGGIPMWAIFTLTVFAYVLLTWLGSRL